MTTPPTVPPESNPAPSWRQFSLRSLLLLAAFAATYAAGWLSNEARHHLNAPATTPASLKVIPQATYSIPVQPLEGIEAGMKADELEWNRRFQLLEDTVPTLEPPELR